jgi:hypothetical protein
VGAHLFDTFLFQKVLKQGDALLPFLLHFAFEYTTGKFQSKPGGKRKSLVCSGDVIFLGQKHEHCGNIEA